MNAKCCVQSLTTAGPRNLQPFLRCVHRRITQLLRRSSRRPRENKFFGGCSEGWFFSFFDVYWLVLVVPPPMAGLLVSGLWRDAHARSLRNKGLELRSLFSFDLDPASAAGWGSGMAAFASSRRWTPI